jgi:TonB family protein
MTVSTGMHALLLLWLVTHPTTSSGRAKITEITLLGGGEPAAAAGSPAPAAAAPAPEPVAGVAQSARKSVHFERKMPRSEVAPDPQSEWAASDRLDARLASLQQSEGPATAGIVTASVPTTLFRAAAPGAAGLGSGGGSGPVTLTRGGSGSGGSGDALVLTRGHGSGGAGTALAIPQTNESAATRAPAQVSESTARRTIAGASLAGPIADRPVLAYEVPVYPEWAKEEAVEASVTLYFVVRPDGGVKENILVQKTAGFEDFDESARAALRAWRFEPLRAGRVGEQWGTITFHFRLRDVG